MEDPPAKNKEQGISVGRKHFVESTKSLFMDKKTADFWFLFGSGVYQVRFPVHKAMLAKESEVFNAMFYGEMKEESNEVQIVDANDDEFTEFAQFFYADRITITITNLPKLMYLATKYLVVDLLKVCDEFIIEHLPVDKLLAACDLAVLYDRFELKAKLEEKISDNAKEFFATNAFRKCSYDTLKKILDFDQLMCDPKDVFDACIDWAKNSNGNGEENSGEMEHIKKQLSECLYRIPFYLMSSEQITQIVNDYEELFDRGEIVELINMMSLSGRINVKKFRYNHDFASYQRANWRMWWRLGGNDQSRRYIGRQEMFHLSYRNRNLLKALQLFYIWHVGNKYCVKILSELMTIVRLATAVSEETILLKQHIRFECENNQLCTSMPTIKFVKPIVFEPLKSYRILFDFDDSWSEEEFYTLKTSTNKTDFLPLICYDSVNQ